jgi:isopenicillin-N epimerase
MGGAAFRRRNIDLAAQATALVARRLNTQPGATGDFAGAMGTVRLRSGDPTPARALAIRARLMASGTDAPVHALDGALWLRLSAFGYNRIEDYDKLATLVAAI